MNDELVSVIIPTYNRARCILQSIQSVLNQTYSNLELLVVDDGSTDDTRAVVQGVTDSRVRYIYKENGGACSARNFGIEEAIGEYLAFQDSDDFWYENKLEIQLKALKQSIADVCICKMRSIDSSNKREKIIPDRAQTPELSKLLFSSFISTQMIVAKKECFEDVRFDVAMPRLQDWDLCIRLMRKYKFIMADEVLVDQHIGADSISKKQDALIRAFELILSKYSQEFNNNKRALANNEKELGNAYLQYGDKQSASHWYKKSLLDYPNAKAAAKLALLCINR